MLATIQAKIVTAVVIVLLVGMSLVTVLTVRSQRTNLLDASRQNVANNSSTLNVSVRNVMLAGEAPIAVSLMNDLSEAPGFETLEVYRRDGTLAFSDFETLEAVNEALGAQEFSRTARRQGPALTGGTLEQVVTFNTPRVIESLDEERLEYYFPILNYQECRACHGSDHFVRGVAYYEVSLASIFDRIGSARNTLLLFYVILGAAVATAIVTLMQRIVVGPIRQIGGVVGRVGEGDLEVEARVRGSREFETLSQKINAMIHGLKERNRLEIENEVIEARDQENRKYLDNIAEGLILIDSDHRISDQYSTYVEQLFATSEIAGKQFSHFIYPEKGQEKERKEIDQFLSMAFENTATEMEMIMSINPLHEKELSVGEGDSARTIVVGTSFQRIWGDSGEVERIMAIFEDRTDIVRTQERLESERERYKSDIEHIATLLRTGPEAYSQFESDARSTIQAVEQAIDKSPEGEERNTLLRDLHSLKGTARYLEFQTVAELANRAEDLLETEEMGTLSEVAQELRNEIEALHSINEKFQSFAAQVAPEEQASAAISEFSSHIERMAREIAGELGKEISVDVQKRVSEFPFLGKLQNPIIHLVRNAVDHGIEDPYQRLTAGKDGTANLTVRLEEDDQEYFLSVIDDGGGIDFDAVRAKAEQLGLISTEREYVEKELLNLLFSPSFSTRQESTDISGRGVGLDVVHEEVRKLGGKISVGTKKGIGTRFLIRIPKEKST